MADATSWHEFMTGAIMPIVRKGLTFISGILIAKGIYTSDESAWLISAVLAAVPLGVSILLTYLNEKANAKKIAAASELPSGASLKAVEAKAATL